MIRVGLPKEVDVEDLVPGVQALPRGTFVRNSRIVHQHSDLDQDEQKPLGGWMRDLGGGEGKEGKEGRGEESNG